MSKILELASKTIEQEQAIKAEKKAKEQAELDTALAKLKLNFEQNFAEALPLLKQDGITYEVGLQKPPYFHEGIFIEFTHAGNTLKMDYTTDQWRYEFVQRRESSPTYGAMTFGKWPMEAFYVYLAKNLLSKEPRQVEVDQDLDNIATHF